MAVCFIQAAARAEEQETLGPDDGSGIYLMFESEPNFSLKYESLDLAQSGMVLRTVRALADSTMRAIVFALDGKLELFLNNVVACRDEDATPGQEGGVARPKYPDLVESIMTV